MGKVNAPRPVAALLASVLAAVTLLAAACDAGGRSPAGQASQAANGEAAPQSGNPAAARPAGPHGGVDLNVLVVTDGSPPVEAIRQELVAEGMPVTVISLRDRARHRITGAYLARTLPGGKQGGNFDGIVLPDAVAAGLSAAERTALAVYESTFGVRQVDAYTPPGVGLGMNGPTYNGLLSGSATVTAAGAADGFGYLNQSFPFSGGPTGQAPYGYLATPRAGTGPGVAIPLITAAFPNSQGNGALVWQYTFAGRQQLAISFAYARYMAQFHYLSHGIVNWLTRGVSLTNWRSYLDIAFDDMILGDAQWSTVGHCTPGTTTCPYGTPATATIRMTPADVTYAVQWEKQRHFTIEFLYNGGSSQRFQVNGTDPLLAAIRPVASDFYWVNHTYSHAYLGCQQDFSVIPWRCARSDGQITWAADTSLINNQIQQNFAWAQANGIPAEPGTLATGEYSGLPMLPQQPVDNPNLDAAMGPNRIQWVAIDASREPGMRPVGAAFGVPRHPIDVGYDVDTVAAEINEYNWNNTSAADGGSGLCQQSKVTRCAAPLSAPAGWTSTIVPGQAQIVFTALLNGDARPFFMHQSNLTGDRIAYPVMDSVLSDYRAVFNASAPIANLPMSGDGAVLRDQQLWAQALKAGTVSAWVQGTRITITGPAGTPVPVTVPAGTRAAAADAEFGSAYGGGRSAYVTLGSQPLTLTLASAPYQP